MTKLGPDPQQVEYRLSEAAGCEADVQADYRLAEEQSVLEWVGGGLAEVGIEAGTVLSGEADKDRARALMDGADPRTGQALMSPKQAIDPRAKLPAAPLVDAVEKACAEAGLTPSEAFEFADARRWQEWGTLVRGVRKSEDRYQAPLAVLERAASVAGVDVDEVYGAAAVAEARKHKDKRVVVGNRGYDLELDVPKSYSVLQAVADPDLSAGMDRVFREAVRETAAVVESWTAWGQRGSQSGGKLAARIDTSGLLGWSMVHYTARPAGGAASDPHLHVHLAFANMAKGVDGKWGAVAGGGRDLMRHAVAANAYLEARVRAKSAAELGLRWHQDPRTGIWEIAAVPAEMRTLFSKRGLEVEAAVAAEDGTVTTRHHQLIAARTAESKEASAALPDLREEWQAQAAEAGFDVAGIARLATARGFAGETVREVEAIAAQVWNLEDGLCAHRKVVSRADVLAAVADAAPGVADLADLDALVDAVLAVDGYAVRLDTDTAGHFTHPQRYTQVDIVEAEQTILAAARDRMAADVAVVQEDIVAAAIEAFELGAGFRLSAEQRAVVTRLATAGNGVDAVIGVAGSGKTTIMEALYAAHQAAGHTVAGASTAAVAAHHLQAETGIPSATIAAWLGRIESGAGLAGVDVLVVDEAAMVDDRQFARLVAAAEASGTQIVGIGDPMQLKSPGVGSTFADVHELVDGLALTDNRRQRHETEVQALAKWRDDDRRAIFDALSTRDAVHAEKRLEGVWSAMIGSWWANVAAVDDPHERLRRHLMIAATNADVDTLNSAAQAIRLAEGELDASTGRDYRVDGGKTLRIHVGDAVAARSNDYNAGLLNGHRGVVTAIGEDGTLTVAIRESDGAEPVLRRVAETYVRCGHLELGYAITGHRAQGQTADTVQVSLTGMDAHAAYAALTRHRDRVDAWLAADVLEDDGARARLGAPGSDRERLERAVDAYVTYLNRPEADPLVLADLHERRGDLLDHRNRPDPEPDPEPRARPRGAQRPVAEKIADAKAAKAADPVEAAFPEPADVDPETPAAEAGPAERPYAALTGRELMLAYARAHQGVQNAEEGLRQAGSAEARHTRETAQAAAQRADAEHGHGPRAVQLAEQRAALGQADEAIGRIATATARLTELRDQAREQYATGSAARRRSEENALKLRLQGTSRAEQTGIAEAAYARINQIHTTEQQARVEQADAEADFRSLRERLPRRADGRWMSRAEVGPALADLEANWPARHEAAAAADLAAVRDPVPPRTTLGQARQRLDDAVGERQEVFAEIEHRHTDPDARTELETARVQLRAEAAAAQRARQAEQQRQIHHHLPRHDHGPRHDRGPDIGGMSR